ncbi:MAG: winged helix-turn-helix domain-containing protein [Solirubrobacteraceae bacterium]
MAGFVDAAVQDLDNRLSELKEEERRLLAARTALVGDVSPRTAERTAAPAGSRTGRSTRATVGRRRGPGRPRGRRGGNTRSAQALELVRNNPGITIPEIAAAMKIEPNYLYRVMPKLIEDGLVRRDGQGWRSISVPASTPEPATVPNQSEAVPNQSEAAPNPPAASPYTSVTVSPQF